MEMLAKQVAMVNGLAPMKSCALVLLPDLAKDSSLRGLFDEERDIQEAFFSLKQCCEMRFIELCPTLHHEQVLFFRVDWQVLCPPLCPPLFLKR